MFNYYVLCLKKYAVFSGRATRSEFWYFTLVNFLIGLALNLLRLNTIYGIYTLFIFIPSLAVFVRRMHDINRSGWNYLWMCIPTIGSIIATFYGWQLWMNLFAIGWIISIIYLCTPTKPGPNKYSA